MVRNALLRASVAPLAGALLFACSSTSQGPAPGEGSGGTATSSIAAAANTAGAAASTPAKDPNTASIKVVALSDFHGWLSPLEPNNYTRYFGGIANLAGSLAHRDKVTQDNGIIIDNGDMWTGPTESTLLRGESVVEAYNALGVTAANVANHEFDFGKEILRARAQEAKFPFLGANIVIAGTSNHPDFVKPYIMVERDSVKIAVIGLSYLHTPKTTLAKHVADLEFKGYAETLKAVLPKVKAEGAEVIVVMLHDEVPIAAKVFEQNPDLKVHMVIAGQNHRKERVDVNGIAIVNPGPFGRSYVRFDVDVDRKSRAVTSVKHEIVDITGEVGAPPYPPSPELAAIAERARQKAKSLSSEVLGRVSSPLQVGTFANSTLGHFVVDAWLSEFPEVDIAMLNHGALRQPLPSGPITMGDIVSAQPFENNLLIVTLTGAQLKKQLLIDSPIVSGISWSYKERKGIRKIVSVVDRVGKKISDKRKYTVIILDFMYTGGDGYTFKDMDTAPVDTGISWREPVVRALRFAQSTNRKLSPRSGARARQLR